MKATVQANIETLPQDVLGKDPSCLVLAAVRRFPAAPFHMRIVKIKRAATVTIGVT